MDPATLDKCQKGFTSDNIAGASPEIVHAIAAAASGQAPPYGADTWTASAQARFAEIFEREVDVIPVSTGSAANALSLAAMTPPWGSVLCHPESHINNDECGAPEFFTNGAKLAPVTGDDSKINPANLSAAVSRKARDVHSVQPSALSLSQATETGTLYSVQEIRELSSIAKEAGLRTHMDGARFANALTGLRVSPADMTWRAGIDLLSFGATKNGAMTADAIVVFDRSLTEELTYRTKRGGQLSSKMRFLAAQLDAYLTDGLWLHNADHANTMASKLEKALGAIPGVQLLNQTQANILFCRLPQHVIQSLLHEGYEFYHDRWEPGVVRFVTSFTTTASDVESLISKVHDLTQAADPAAGTSAGGAPRK